MRTTMTIDDELMARLRDAAHRDQLPMRILIDRVLRAGLRSLGAHEPDRVACPTFSMGSPGGSPGTGTPAVDLDHAGALAAVLEDEEILRKLDRRE